MWLRSVLEFHLPRHASGGSLGTSARPRSQGALVGVGGGREAPFMTGSGAPVGPVRQTREEKGVPVQAAKTHLGRGPPNRRGGGMEGDTPSAPLPAADRALSHAAPSLTPSYRWEH